MDLTFSLINFIYLEPSSYKNETNDGTVLTVNFFILYQFSRHISSQKDRVIVCKYFMQVLLLLILISRLDTRCPSMSLPKCPARAPSVHSPGLRLILWKRYVNLSLQNLRSVNSDLHQCQECTTISVNSDLHQCQECTTIIMH